jgi:hypothetical protein
MIPTTWELIPWLLKWLTNTGFVVRRQWVDEKIEQHSFSSCDSGDVFLRQIKKFTNDPVAVFIN